MLAPWKESYDKHRQLIKKQRHHFAGKGPYSRSYSFSSSHVWMWELDHKEGWELKNWCFRIVVLEKTFWESLHARRSNQSILKEINPEYSLEGLMLKLKLNICCCCSVAQSCPTLCDPTGWSTPGLPVLCHLPELAQTHVHWVSDAIQPSHPRLSPSPPAFNLSQHQSLF